MKPPYKNIKVGDMVRAFTQARSVDECTLPAAEGIVTDIQERQVLFSDKYAITETETSVHILSGGEIRVFFLEEDYIEVINEAG